MTSTHTLRTVTGAALVGSCLLSVIGGMIHPIHGGESHTLSTLTDPAFPYAHLLIYIGALLLMVGLPGAFVFWGPRLGRTGRLGLVLYFLANAVVVQGGLLVEGMILPAIARDPLASHLVLHGGTLNGATWFNTLQAVAGMAFLAALVLIGIGLFRSRLVPRAIGVVLIVGALLLFAPLPEVPVLTGLLIELPRGLAVASLGLLLLRTPRRSPTHEAALATA